MKYRIIARTPYERTSYAEPCETVHQVRQAISIGDAFQIVRKLSDKEENYDVSFEVWDDEGKQHHFWDYDNAAHVRTWKLNPFGDGDIPW